MNLVASMIAKNEMGRYLPEVVGHLREFCDQIIVLDDGSTDRTGEWLRDNTDDRMIVQHLNPEDGFFAGHEGRKRQELLSFTLNQLPDWVLAIDADEFISDGQAVRTFCEDSQGRQVGTLPMEEIWKAEPAGLMIRTDGGWRPHPVPCLWSAKLSGYRGRALTINQRPLACGREPEAVRRLFHRARPTGSSIMHFGWAKESDRKGRYDRYVTADGGKYHRNAHLESIMFPDMDCQFDHQPWPTALKPYKAKIVEQAA